MVLFSLAFEGDKPLEAYVRYALLMEKYGFYSMQVYEHLPHRPAWPIVFHVAKYTKRLKLGPVTVPAYLYHPIVLARYLALLDELTGGRALAGFSRGAYYRLAGRRASHTRRVGELVEAVSSLLEGGVGGYRGEFYTISGELRLWWREGRRVEIYIGTSGPRLACVAASIPVVRGVLVDNLWNPQYARFMLDQVRRCAAESGREPREVQLIPRPFCYIAEDEGEAREGIIPHLRHYLPDLVGDSPMLRWAGITPHDLMEFRAGRAIEGLEAIIRNFSAAGTVDSVIEQTSRMIEVGVSHICYGHPLGGQVEEAIRILGEKVIPYFAGWGPEDRRGSVK